VSRKLLAILLVFSWVVLSGLDVAEDLNVPVDIALHSGNPIDDSMPNAGHPGPLTNNVLEWSDRIEASSNPFFGLPVFALPLEVSKVSKRAANIHKLLCVFLI
jgi:hypothetical protein